MEEMKKRFKERYKKSEIYNPIYVDWFPDDVMQFMQNEINLAVSKERERIVQAINQLRLKYDAWKHTFPQEYSEGYRIAIDDIETNLINTK